MAVTGVRAGRARFAAHVLLLALTTGVFVWAHARHANLPSGPAETDGWAGWADQSQYIRASRAWSAGDLRRSEQWYPPGYALLGAPFLGVTPTDRFLLPNIMCLMTAQLACAALGRRLLAPLPLAGLTGAAAFALASMALAPARDAWVVPWTTTPVTALSFTAFAATLRLVERPTALRACLAGACIGAIPLFRPTDAVPVALAAAAAALPMLLRLPVGRALRIGGAGIAGSCAAGLGAAALIAVTSGFGPGGYVARSAAVGFEWRLLPLRWVSLIVSPRPVFNGVTPPAAGLDVSHGFAEVFPWVVLGVGGIATSLIARPIRAAPAMLAVWLAAHMALTLAYRDLHIVGLWAFGNVHYLKATLPVLLMFAVLLAVKVTEGPRRAASAAAAAAAIVLAFGWRASLVATGAEGTAPDVATAVLPGMRGLDSAAVLRGGGWWSDTSAGPHTLDFGSRSFDPSHDFRLYPRGPDMLVVPLRMLPDGPGVLHLAGHVTLDAGAPVVEARQKIVFALPCMFGLAGRAVCRTESLRETPTAR